MAKDGSVRERSRCLWFAQFYVAFLMDFERARAPQVRLLNVVADECKFSAIFRAFSGLHMAVLRLQQDYN